MIPSLILISHQYVSNTNLSFSKLNWRKQEDKNKTKTKKPEKKIGDNERMVFKHS